MRIQNSYDGAFLAKKLTLKSSEYASRIWKQICRYKIIICYGRWGPESSLLTTQWKKFRSRLNIIINLKLNDHSLLILFIVQFRS